jgi:hypothetical protein
LKYFVCGDIKAARESVMRNTIKLFGIIALVAIIGFTAMGCSNSSSPFSPNPNVPDGPNTPIGSSQYAGKDVLGNSYSLLVGSNVSRAAEKGDRYQLDVKTRDGKTRNVKGTVTDISTDGTLTLKPDGSADEFTAQVGGSSLNSVASGGEIAQLPLSDGTTLTPRTFGKINLRAARWDNGNGGRGENWGSGLSVLVKDFPTNVSRLTADPGRYTITVSGTVDATLSHFEVEVQGLTADDRWIYLGGNTEGKTINANTPFTQTFTLNIDPVVSLNLMDYKEIILQVTNVKQKVFDAHPEWNVNNGTIPADIPDGQIMATISNFKISLKDAQKEALKGNAGDYTFGFQEDGLSVEYRQAVWSLSADNVAKAKKSGAKFEFIMLDVDDIAAAGTAISFIWQDPVRGLWWQDMTAISGGDERNNWAFTLGDGASWDSYRKKMTIDLSTVIKDNRFAASTQLNFIVACWWYNNTDCKNIDELDIAGANIVVIPPVSGNMGTWNYGYQEDGISTNYTQAIWHLNDASQAKIFNARLELEFSTDITNRKPFPVLALVWQSINGQRWWPTDAEAGPNNENIIIYSQGFKKPGVSYSPIFKRLTIELPTALETYNVFKTSANINLVLNLWDGVTTDIADLGIVSANIVLGPYL